MISAVYCVRCRQQIDSADVFCRSCGADQRPPSQQTSMDPDTTTVQLPLATPVQLGSKRKGWAVPAIIVFLSVSLGVLLWPRMQHLSGGFWPATQVPVLTVSAVRGDVLRYNGQHVILHATVVDTSRAGAVATPYLRIGDSPQAYWNELMVGFGLAKHNGDFEAITMKVIPRPTGADVRSTGEFEGVYDGNTNTLNLTRYKITGVSAERQ